MYMNENQKTKNQFIQKILGFAKEKNIPLKDDPDMMKVLLKLDFGRDVPIEFYKVVTEILSFVYKVSKKADSY